MSRRTLALVAVLVAASGGAWFVTRTGPAVDEVGGRHASSIVEAPARLPGLEGSKPTGAEPRTPPASADETAAGDSNGNWSGTQTYRVVSAADETPIEGALVRVTLRFPRNDLNRERREGRTGPDGRVTLPCPFPYLGLWTVRKRGFVSALFDEDEMFVISAQTIRTRDEIALTPAPVLSGRVVLAGTHAAVVGARVVLWAADRWTSGAIDESQTTDSAGGFEFAGAPPHEYLRVAVAAEGYGTVIVPLRPGEGRRPLEIEMGRGATLGGTVRDERGRVVAGAEVFVAERGGDDPLEDPTWDRVRQIRRDVVGALRVRTRSGPDGRYGVRGLATPAAYVVSVRAPGGRSGRSDPVELRTDADARGEADVAAVATGSILVTAPSLSEDDVKRVSLGRCWRDAAWSDYARRREPAWSWPDRGFVFESVTPGPHRVFIAALPFVSTSRDVVVQAGARAEVRLDLDRGVELAGRIIDTEGRAIREGTVSFEAIAGDLEYYRTAETEGDGAFTLRALPRLAGTLSAHVAGYERVTRTGVVPGSGGAGPQTLTLKRGARVFGRWRPGIDAWTMEVTYEAVDGRSETYDVPFTADEEWGIDWIPANTRFDLVVRAEGHAPWTRRDLTVAEGATLDLGELAFPDPHTLRGVVRDVVGVPVVGARVRVAGASEAATTDESGVFRLSLLAPGPTTVLVAIEGAVWARAPVEVRAPEESLEITLPAPGRITAVVRDGRGESQPAMPLELTPVAEDGSLAERRRVIVRTDGLGRIEVSVAPGRYRLEPPGTTGRAWTTAQPDIDVASGETVTLERVVK